MNDIDKYINTNLLNRLDELYILHGKDNFIKLAQASNLTRNKKQRDINDPDYFALPLDLYDYMAKKKAVSYLNAIGGLDRTIRPKIDIRRKEIVEAVFNALSRYISIEAIFSEFPSICENPYRDHDSIFDPDYYDYFKRKESIYL